MAGLHTKKQYAAKPKAKQYQAQPKEQKSPEVEQKFYLWVLLHPEMPVNAEPLNVKANIIIDGENFLINVVNNIVRTYSEKLAKHLISQGYQILSKELSNASLQK